MRTVRARKWDVTNRHATFRSLLATPQTLGRRDRTSCPCDQRNLDVFLGLPFKITSNALLTQMLAPQCDLDDFAWTGGDRPVYNSRIDQMRTQFGRESRAYPQTKIRRRPDSIFSDELEDFQLLGYAPHPATKAMEAV